MKLSKQQLEALANELIIPIRERQQNQVKRLKEKLQKEVLAKVKKLYQIDFSDVGKKIVSIRVNLNCILDEFNVPDSGRKRNREVEAKSYSDITNKVVALIIKKKFELIYGHEITVDTIKHAIILETIGSSSVEELTKAVQKRFGFTSNKK